MSMRDKDAVSWDRPERTGAKSALGHAGIASAAGYPQTVTGNWQETSRRGPIKVQGQEVTVDAVFISYTFSAGKNGDRVTRAGLAYLVVGARPATKRNSSEHHHTEYYLSAVAAGAGV